jgi:hypothetical protein
VIDDEYFEKELAKVKRQAVPGKTMMLAGAYYAKVHVLAIVDGDVVIYKYWRPNHQCWEYVGERMYGIAYSRYLKGHFARNREKQAE